MKFTTISLGFALILAGACSSGPYVPTANPKNPEVNNYPVVLLNEDLQRTVAMDVPPSASRTPSGQLRIQVGLRNRTDKEVLQVQAQTLFRNANGLVLYCEPGSEAPWQNLSLTPGQTVYYTQTSLTPEATAFTVRVRYTQQ